jgi:hypothetical protein
MKGIQLDTEPGVVDEHYAVVYAPRRNRERFAAGAVEVVATESEARAAADPDGKRYAARVLGPSRSSEGLQIYYLVEWLD